MPQPLEVHIPLKVSEKDKVRLKVSENEKVGLKVSEYGGTSNYQRLINKPSINGTELFDNYDEIDPTVPEWAKNETKPTYNYDEVGAVGAENELHFEEIDRMFNAVFGV